MKTGIEIIADERARQINKEGWSAQHDDAHYEGDIAKAAACYAMPAASRNYTGHWHDYNPPLEWPWDRYYWKPTPADRIRELAKAGALIAAEIDRLNRKATP